MTDDEEVIIAPPLTLEELEQELGPMNVRLISLNDFVLIPKAWYEATLQTSEEDYNRYLTVMEAEEKAKEAPTQCDLCGESFEDMSLDDVKKHPNTCTGNIIVP